MRQPFSMAAVLFASALAGCFNGFDPETVKCQVGVTADCPREYVCVELGQGSAKCRRRGLQDGSSQLGDVGPLPPDAQADVSIDSGGAADGAGRGDSAKLLDMGNGADGSAADGQLAVDSRTNDDGAVDAPVPPPADAPVDTGGGAGTGGVGGTTGAGGTTGIRDANGAAGGATGGSSSTGGRGSGGIPGSGGVAATGGIVGMGGANGSGGIVGTGGAVGTGGTPGTGGLLGVGGAGTGGAIGTGGANATGGAPGTGGVIGTGGSAGAASVGCGKTSTITFGAVPNETGSGFGSGGYVTIQSGGATRGFAMRLPDNYDNNRPYWLIFAFHWNGGLSADIDGGGTHGHQASYFGLQAMSNNGAIFVAPQGLNSGWANSGGRDLTFVDDMVKLIEDNYCVDTTHLFANGFSYGAGMAYAIACARASVFRGVALYEGAQLSGCDGGTSPIAYWQMAGLTDGTVTIGMGTSLRNKFSTNNGCTIGSEPPRPPGPPPYLDPGGHICTDYAGCSAGHPLRWCVHQSGHGWAIEDGTSDLYDTNQTTWVPADVWAFFTSL